MQKNKNIVLLSFMIVFITSCSMLGMKPQKTKEKKVVHIVTKKDLIDTPSSPNISVEWTSNSNLSLYGQEKVTKKYDPKQAIEQALNKSYQIRISELLQKDIDNQKKVAKTVSYINLKDGIISYAETRKTAQALANKKREVFFGFKGASVKDTLSSWAKSVGCSIIWDVDFDYLISQDFVAYGELTSDGGALEQVLRSLRSTNNPVRATIKSNNAILIQSFGYKMSAIS